MPALPFVSHVVKVNLHFSLPGDANAQFGKFFQYTGALSVADAQTWCDAIHLAYSTRMGSQFYSGCTLLFSTLTDLTSATGAQVISATPHPGTNVNPSQPSGLAMVMKDKIARRYRGGHPKTYIPGMPAAGLGAGNLWTAGEQAGVIAAWNLWVSDCLNAVPVAAAPATEVNVSYFQGFHNVTLPSGRVQSRPTLRVTPSVDTIIGHSINPVAASQRRRNETP